MKHRIEFFSDGVYAIIITLLVLELHGPTEPGIMGWVHQLPELFAFLLTVGIIGIAWQGSLYFLSLYRVITPIMLWLFIATMAFNALIPLILHNLVNNFGDPATLVIYQINILFSVLPMHIVRIIVSEENLVYPELWPQLKKRSIRASIVTLIVSAVVSGVAFLSFWAGFMVFVLFSIWYAVDIAGRMKTLKEEL